MDTLVPDVELVWPISGRMVFRGKDDLRVLATAVYSSLTGLRWRKEVGDDTMRVVIGDANVGPLKIGDATGLRTRRGRADTTDQAASTPVARTHAARPQTCPKARRPPAADPPRPATALSPIRSYGNEVVYRIARGLGAELFDLTRWRDNYALGPAARFP